MKDKVFSVLQRVGRSFMLPIAILPVAGLLLGLGSSFTNATTIETYHLERLLGDGTLLHGLLVIMNNVGSAIFDNLPLIFAVGVAIGMAHREKEVAALSSLIAFFVMHVSINAILKITGKFWRTEIPLRMSFPEPSPPYAAFPHCRWAYSAASWWDLALPPCTIASTASCFPMPSPFFGGSRFVPIISTLVYLFVGIAMYFVWPVVQNGIYGLGKPGDGNRLLGNPDIRYCKNGR